MYITAATDTVVYFGLEKLFSYRAKLMKFLIFHCFKKFL